MFPIQLIVSVVVGVKGINHMRCVTRHTSGEDNNLIELAHHLQEPPDPGSIHDVDGAGTYFVVDLNHLIAVPLVRETGMDQGLIEVQHQGLLTLVLLPLGMG